ncbi:prefoldin subunit 2 [Trypanosoma theileri]|uniref:Prefoldin subunit 2 n=1 Tax=Trypanosoma theileri TaxID=67003 RepID=A0A1X0NMS2_9TRYP|nr:prefoldin subunit 2 [Trypanosoma theileri]ORC85987.1 prefoldin subunit 2 [Trypanosoma theileri]
MTSSNAASNNLSEEAIVQRYQQMRQECLTLVSRISELENELHEHKLVADALRPLNGDRRCHRLVGGALIERTVADILPELEENINAIQEAVEQINKRLTERQTAMEEFARKHGVKVAQQNGQTPANVNSDAEAARKASDNADQRGVLV